MRFVRHTRSLRYGSRRVRALQSVALGLLTMFFFGTSSSETAPSPVPDQVRILSQRAGARVSEFVSGPRYLEFPANPNATCADLYAQMRRIMPRTYNYKPDFYDDPRNEALGLLGFVYAPVFYGWALTSLDNYFDGRNIAKNNMRLDALRQAAADQDCWVRY